MHRLLPAALTLAAIVWCVTLIAAPYALISDNPRLVSSAAAVYSAAGLICHQRAARSFHLAGVQLPVCGRCAGLYVSGALGAMLGWAASRRPRAGAWTRRLLLLAAVPTAMSVILEFSGLAHPSNFVRAACAVPLGAAAGWIFVQSLRADATAADGTATFTTWLPREARTGFKPNSETGERAPAYAKAPARSRRSASREGGRE